LPALLLSGPGGPSLPTICLTHAFSPHHRVCGREAGRGPLPDHRCSLEPLVWDGHYCVNNLRPRCTDGVWSPEGAGATSTDHRTHRDDMPHHLAHVEVHTPRSGSRVQITVWLYEAQGKKARVPVFLGLPTISVSIRVLCTSPG
jgi:hypothetical protein